MHRWFPIFRECTEHSGSSIDLFTVSTHRVYTAIITFLIYRNAAESHLWHFLEKYRVPKIRRLEAPDLGCMSRKRRSGFERYERTFIGVETSSSFRAAWSHRNERELFSTRRRINNGCTTNVCSEFYSFTRNFWSDPLTIFLFYVW